MMDMQRAAQQAAITLARQGIYGHLIPPTIESTVESAPDTAEEDRQVILTESLK